MIPLSEASKRLGISPDYLRVKLNRSQVFCRQVGAVKVSTLWLIDEKKLAKYIAAKS